VGLQAISRLASNWVIGADQAAVGSLLGISQISASRTFVGRGVIDDQLYTSRNILAVHEQLASLPFIRGDRVSAVCSLRVALIDRHIGVDRADAESARLDGYRREFSLIGQVVVPAHPNFPCVNASTGHHNTKGLASGPSDRFQPQFAAHRVSQQFAARAGI
jgi:hypothetical protein